MNIFLKQGFQDRNLDSRSPRLFFLNVLENTDGYRSHHCLAKHCCGWWPWASLLSLCRAQPAPAHTDCDLK